MNEKVIVAIVTMDFRLAYEIQVAIKDYFSYTHLTLSDDYSKAGIIVTSHIEYNRISHQNKIVIYHGSLPSKIRSLIITKLRQSEDNCCIIGIDPGKSIGVAIIYRKSIIITNIFTSEVELVYWIRLQLRNIPTFSIEFKIGNGSKKYSSKLFEIINKEFQEVAIIKLVDEFRTSIRGIRKHSIHEESAIRIARRD